MLFNRKGNIKPINRCFYALGTINYITVFGEKHSKALDLAMDRVYEIDNNMSVFKNDSEVTLINKYAGVKETKVSKDTYHVIERAVHFSKLTSGALNISTRPLSDLWSQSARANRLPTKEDIQTTLKLVDINNVILNKEARTVLLANKGQAIDLGAIAKGFAADQVRSILKDYGVKNALINLGGNVVVLGKDPSNRKPWNVGIQDPDRKTGVPMGILSIRNKAIVTSAGNERFHLINGEKYHHILDPNSGLPANSDIKSVTVVANSSTDADALATGFFILGKDKSVQLLNSLPSVDAIIITKNNKVYITKRIAKHFKIISERYIGYFFLST